jgi:cytochrome c biogenesis protein CcdA
MIIFFAISLLAGILTVLAPCILPILPIVISSTGGSSQGISKRAVTVILSLSISVAFFTILLKSTTLLIAIPVSFWGFFSGTIIILVGLALFFPNFYSSLSLVQNINIKSNQALGEGFRKKTKGGDILMGFALGPVFTTCSPTYLFIVATILPASFGIGFLYLMGYIIGFVISLILIAYFGERLVGKVSDKFGTAEKIKRIFAVIIIIVGLAILTGYDKKLEAYILDLGYGATINLEENLIKRFMSSKNGKAQGTMNINIPLHLRQAFIKTDWSRVDPVIESAISGGPGRDGIPSINNPKFDHIASFMRDDDTLAVVIERQSEVRVYPYNILIWHEIVNDQIGGKDIAVTFCPLCGSAIVFERKIDGVRITFGVSGSLIESNMIMYDKESESLWQQSTGLGIAGKHLGKELTYLSFQLLTIKEIRESFPNAKILSENTGFIRNYEINPYKDYDESDSFIFSPSMRDSRYPLKMIFVAYQVGERRVATPWLTLERGKNYQATIDDKLITLTKIDSELMIIDNLGNKIPFYFEMWFSWAVQNAENGIVFDPNK